MNKETQVGKRVRLILEKYAAGDYTEALRDAVFAIQATARKEYPRIEKDNEQFKTFLADPMNMNILTCLILGHPIANIGLQCSHPILDPKKHKPISTQTQTPSYGLETILYHVVRCSFAHEDEMPPEVIITDDVIGDTGQVVSLPKSTILGLALVVVASGVNKIEVSRDDLFVTVRGLKLAFSKLWGKRAYLHKLLVSLPKVTDAK